jgi:hypothetical protein
MNIHNIPELLHGEFVIVGGGILGALGIRETSDIDLIVSKRLFDELSNESGWTLHTFGNTAVLKKGMLDVGIKYGSWTYDNLVKDSQIIDGLRYINIHKLLEHKQSSTREKDQKDIKLIQSYLSS